MNILSEMEDEDIDIEGRDEDSNNLSFQENQMVLDQKMQSLSNENKNAGRWTDEEHERFLEGL